MAWSVVASAVGTNTATMPAHQVGDYLIVGCCRDGSNTAPSLVTGWVNINAPGGTNSFSHRIAWRVATSTSMVTGTWTNATSCIVLVIRNGSHGPAANGATSNGNNSTFSYPAITMNVTSGANGLLGFVFSADGTSAAAVQTAPSGMTNQDSVKDATDAAGVHYDLSATSWGTTTVAQGVSAVWRTYVLEIYDETPAANNVGYTSMGASSGVSPNYIATKFTPSANGNIDCMKVVMQHPGGAGDSLSMAVFADNSGAPGALLFYATTPYVTVDIGVHIVKFTAFTNDNGTPIVQNGVPLWITAWDNSAGNILYFSDSGAAGQTKQDTVGASTFPTWPDPYQTASLNSLATKLSLWIEYTPTAAGGNTTDFFQFF